MHFYETILGRNTIIPFLKKDSKEKKEKKN